MTDCVLRTTEECVLKLSHNWSKTVVPKAKHCDSQGVFGAVARLGSGSLFVVHCMLEKEEPTGVGGSRSDFNKRSML